MALSETSLPLCMSDQNHNVDDGTTTPTEISNDDGLSSKVFGFIGISKSFGQSLYEEYVPDVETISSIPYNLVSWIRGRSADPQSHSNTGAEPEVVMQPRESGYDGNDTETDIDTVKEGSMKAEENKPHPPEQRDTGRDIESTTVTKPVPEPDPNPGPRPVKSSESEGLVKLVEKPSELSTAIIEDSESVRELKEILRIGKDNFFGPAPMHIPETGGKSDGEDLMSIQPVPLPFPDLKKLEDELQGLQDLCTELIRRVASESTLVCAQVVPPINISSDGNVSPSCSSKMKKPRKASNSSSRNVQPCSSETSLYSSFQIFHENDTDDEEFGRKKESRRSLHRKRVTFATPPSETNIYAYHEAVDSDADDEEGDTQEDEEEAKTVITFLGRPVSPKLSESLIYSPLANISSLTDYPTMVKATSSGSGRLSRAPSKNDMRGISSRDVNGNKGSGRTMSCPPSRRPSTTHFRDDVVEEAKAKIQKMALGVKNQQVQLRRPLITRSNSQIKVPISPAVPARRASFYHFVHLDQNDNETSSEAEVNGNFIPRTISKPEPEPRVVETFDKEEEEEEDVTQEVPRKAINVPSPLPSRIPIPIRLPELPQPQRPTSPIPHRTRSTKSNRELDENANQRELRPTPFPSRPQVTRSRSRPTQRPPPPSSPSSLEVDDTDATASSSEDSSITSYYDFLVETETQTEEIRETKTEVVEVPEPKTQIINKKVTFANIPSSDTEAGEVQVDLNGNESSGDAKEAKSLPIILKTSPSTTTTSNEEKKESLPVMVMTKAEKDKLDPDVDIVKNVLICINIQTTPSDKEDTAYSAEPTEPYSNDERNDYTRPIQRHTLVVSPRMID